MALIDDLIAYWTLDETSGTRADSHGSNDLADNNTVGSAAGKIGTAADFIRANSEYLSIADNADLSTGDIDFTIQAWLWLNSHANSYYIVGKWETAGNNREYLLYFFSGDATFNFGVSNDGSTFVTAASIPAHAAGEWGLVHCWHDAANNQLGIAVNAGTPVTAAWSNGVFDGAAPFRIGQADTGTNFLDGRADEVAVWKRVLTSQERTDLYNGGAGLAYPFAPGGLVRHRRYRGEVREPVFEYVW